MKKRISITGAIGASLLAAALCAGPALAGPRANTSQKGSLLIFPLINVDPEDSTNTLIEISNDNIAPVNIKCVYVNERKGRRFISFSLTPKQTASWEVLTGTGDIAAGLFPPETPWPGPGNPNRGELICFAVDAGYQNQIAWNHLTGTATVVDVNDSDATQARQAFRYNAWAFAAKGTAGIPKPDGLPQGTPGRLDLTGVSDGKSYDACPAYNIVNFMPNGATFPNTPVRTIDNDLSVVSCNQDLRQDFDFHTTKLLFTLWNAHEQDFSAYICIDSVASVSFGGGDRSGGLVGGTNFDFSTLQTTNARYQVQGIPSSQCPSFPFGATESAGLLGVANASLQLAPVGDEDQEVASTTHAAGLQAGFILWDPRGPVLRAPAKR